MRTEKSFPSMIFVMTISLVLILVAIVLLFTTKYDGIPILSYSFIVFLTPVFLYSLLLFLRNYKNRNNYSNKALRGDIEYFSKFSTAPSIKDLNGSRGKDRDNKEENANIFIEKL
jgi:hypothetical protein